MGLSLLQDRMRGIMIQLQNKMQSAGRMNITFSRNIRDRRLFLNSYLNSKRALGNAAFFPKKKHQLEIPLSFYV